MSLIVFPALVVDDKGRHASNGNYKHNPPCASVARCSYYWFMGGARCQPWLSLITLLALVLYRTGAFALRCQLPIALPTTVCNTCFRIDCAAIFILGVVVMNQC